MSSTIVPVILCGGAGSRLWPVSRQLLPKQFLPLVTGCTLLQDTALACEKEDPVLLVLASDHAIRGMDAFKRAVHQAAEVAAAGMLATFGIAATRPDSGFGYIERG